MDTSHLSDRQLLEYAFAMLKTARDHYGVKVFRENVTMDAIEQRIGQLGHNDHLST